MCEEDDIDVTGVNKEDREEGGCTLVEEVCRTVGFTLGILVGVNGIAEVEIG